MSDTTTQVEVAPNPNAISLGSSTPSEWIVNQPGYDGTISVRVALGDTRTCKLSDCRRD